MDNKEMPVSKNETKCETKKKGFFKKIFDKESYSDCSVYVFNMSVFAGVVILAFFSLILFFCV